MIRRRFQFSIRLLLLLACLSCVLAAWWAARRDYLNYMNQIAGINKTWVPLNGTSQVFISTNGEVDALATETLDDLKLIPNLARLRRFTLAFVTPRALYYTEHVRLFELTSLEYLGFSGVDVSGEGIEHLKRLGNLSELAILRTNLSDNDLEQLHELRGLKVLELGCPDLGDDSLSQLRGMTQLKMLIFRKTKVTEEGANQLRAAMPGCTILVNER